MTPSTESLALIKWSKPGIIYVARNRVNGKLYVGQTVRHLSVRLCDHRRRAEEGSKSAFHQAIRKYGFESFDFAVVQNCTDRGCINAAEVWWIANLGCIYPKGYNLTIGGNYVIPSESVRGRKKPSRGPASPEAKNLLLEYAKKPWSDKRKMARSESMKGMRITWNLKGIPHPGARGQNKSEETRIKMSVWQKGSKRPWLNGNQYRKNYLDHHKTGGNI